MSQGARPALQSRSRATRDKLVVSLERCLRKKTFENITVAEIAKEAGLAVGTVYRRFENKDAFIPVLFEIYRSRLDELHGEAGGIEVDPTDGLRGVLRQIAEKSWAFMQAQKHIIAAAHLYSRLRPDLIGDEWDDLLEAGAKGFEALVLAFPDEVRRDPAEAGQMMAYHFNTALAERGLYGAHGVAAMMTITDEEFVRAIADFAYGYLVTEAAQ